MKITLEEIYFMYIQTTVEIVRWLKGRYLAVLHVYNTKKKSYKPNKNKRDLCFKGHIFIQEDL